MQRVLGLRERKRLAARTALEKAALDLFNEKGFGATTIDEIAREAEYSRSTFFRHFGSKEAVLFSAYDEAGQVFSDLVMKRPPDEPLLRAYEEAVVEISQMPGREEQQPIFEARMRLLASDPALMARSREIVETWEERIAQALARREGLDKPGRQHRLAAGTGLAVWRSVTEEWRAKPDADVVQLIRANFEALRELCG